jgi:hypothetical protein
MEISKTVLDSLTDLRNNGDVYGEDYTDPLNGADILIVRKDERGPDGQTRTSYANAAVWKGRQNTQLHASMDQMRAWLDPDTAPNLDFKCRVMPFEDIIKAGEKLKEGGHDALVASPSDGRKALRASSGAFGGGTAEAALGDQEGLDADTTF